MAGFSKTVDDPGTFLGQLDDLYGAGRFALLGVEGRLHLSNAPPSPLATNWPTPRGTLEIGGRFHPAVLDVEGAYGWLDVQAAAAVPLGVRRWEIAVRAGGRKIWGEAPWFHLAYIGGKGSLRGWPSERFAGTSSVFAGAEARVDVFDFDLLLPGTFGLSGVADGGRVWAEANSSSTWHTGFGGGVWLGLRGTRSIVSLVYARSAEDDGWYLGVGFPF